MNDDDPDVPVEVLDSIARLADGQTADIDDIESVLKF